MYNNDNLEDMYLDALQQAINERNAYLGVRATAAYRAALKASQTLNRIRDDGFAYAYPSKAA